MACTNPRRTGRSRTVTFSGDTVCKGVLKWTCIGIISHEINHTYGYILIQCLGFEFTLLAHVDPGKSPGGFCPSDFGSPPPVTEITQIDVSYLGSPVYSHNTNTQHFPGIAADTLYTADMSGDWTISVPVEEWEEIVTPDDVTTIDGTDFPNAGGTAQQDGVPGRRRVLVEIPTGDISITINAGPESYSNTFTPPASPISYVTYAVAGAETIQSADTETASTTILFNGVHLGCPYTYSDISGSVTCSDGVSATAVGRPFPLAEFVYCVMSIAPPIKTRFEGIARSMGIDFPGSVTANYVAGTISNSVALSPTGSINVDMNEYEAFAETNATARTGLSSLQQGIIYAHLTSASLTANNDDTRDRRLQARGKSWLAGTIAHEAYVDLDDGSDDSPWAAGSDTTVTESSGVLQFVASGGVGSATRTFSPVSNAEGYAYLRVRWRSTVNDNVSLTMEFTNSKSSEDKSYTDSTDVAGTWKTVDIDLLVPDTTTLDHDEQESRYPLTGFAEVPMNSSDFWGLNVLETLLLSGIPDGETVEIDYIRLARVSGTPRFSVLPSFLPWLDAWTSPTDNTFHRPTEWVEVEGRAVDRCAFFRVEPFAAADYFRYYSLDEALTDLGQINGVTIVKETVFADDCYTLANYGLFLWGGGHLYRSGAWTHAFDVDITTAVDLYAQDLWDEYQVYPDCGDPENSGYTVGERTPFRVAKSLRGQGWGVLMDMSYNRKDMTIAQLLDWPSTGASASAGTGTSDAQGRFATGTPFGKGNRRHKLYAQAKPTIYKEVTPLANRMRHRGVFFVEGTAGSIHLCKSPFGHAFATIANGDYIDVQRFTLNLSEDSTLHAFTGLTNVTYAQSAWYEPGHLVMVYSEDGTVKTSTSLSHGDETFWSTPMDIGSGTNCAIAILPKDRFIYVPVYDTDRWKLYLQIDGGAWNYISDIVMTTDGTYAAGIEVTDDAGSPLIFVYYDSGTIKRVYSTDHGDTWNSL